MRYADFLKIKDDFQASINLEYDLNKIEKINSYIPTEQSVKVLGHFLRTFYYDNEPQNRATVLVGPYGRGKSHLLLVLSALTSLDLLSDNEGAKATQNDLCNRISSVNKEIGALAQTIVDMNIRTLPVLINSNSTDINQAFLVALRDALDRANLVNLLPNTYFDAAVEVIEKWEKSFPEAYGKYIQELRKEKKTADEVYIGLKQFDRSSYELFCKCYPSVSAGAEFNPMTNMDVVKLYMAVVDALTEQTQYSGINIIFDEFSKFLESNLDKSKMLNFKIIQDMAEAATRSGKKQIHFTCVTHKDILDYSASDSFKTVEGRFSNVRFVASSEQSYELIGNAIEKQLEFNQLYKNNMDLFCNVASCYSVTDVFKEIPPESFEEKIVLGCFPLLPMAAYALLHISEIVGQNERTLFTYLLQKDELALGSFLDQERDTVGFVTVDLIYNYFEDLFKKEIFNSRIYSVWAKTNSALRLIRNESQKKIIKTIAVINIIANDGLKPIPMHIKACLMMDSNEFEQAIKELQKNQILSQRETLEYVLLTASEINVNKAIENYSNTKVTKIIVSEELNRLCDLGYIMPREYNDKFSMLRYFKNIYMGADAFLHCRNANQLLLDYPYDGIIIHIIDSDNSRIPKVLQKLVEFKDHPEIILCVSDVPFIYDDLLRKAVSIEHLKIENSGDSEYFSELESFEDDAKKRIKEIISTMFAPNSKHSSFHNCNGEISVLRMAMLSKEISHICNERYNKTPIINNEMVNKNVLNAQNIKGRDIVVDWILEHSDDNQIPCMDGYGPEVSIFKSAYKQTGLDIAPVSHEEGINAVLAQIKAFIAGCEKQRGCFFELYKVLTSAPFGMRKGIIPLMIAYALRPYKENVVLYYMKKEVELSSSILGSLNDDPANYYLLIENGTKEREAYLESLDRLFKRSQNQPATLNKTYSVVKNMQTWMRSLPEYTKKFTSYYENGETKELPSKIISIRSELLKFEVNSRQLLFETFVDVLSTNKNYDECANKISTIKTFLDSHIANFRKELAIKLTALFVPGYRGSLSNAVISWYKQLPDSTKKHMFDANTNELLSLAKDVTTFDDDHLLDKIALRLASISIEDWNDNLASSFLRDISESIVKINEYHEEQNQSNGKCKVSITLSNVKHEKTFEMDSISPLGKSALSNLEGVFEEYNDALEPDEKLAILAKLIEKIIH